MPVNALAPRSAEDPVEFRADALPLRWAGLCPDCEVIYDDRQPCPYCGSTEAIDLWRVLGAGK